MTAPLVLRWRLPTGQAGPMATVVGPRGERGDTRSFAVTIGDGLSTLFLVDHDLGTRNVVVGVRRSGTGADVIADVARPTDNRVTVSFRDPPALDEFVVTVLG